MNIKIPEPVTKAINILEEKNYKCYVVGGCVRDALLSEKPQDWDLCTSAVPEEIMEIFTDFFVIPTGLQHGTVTVVIDHMHLEITTFRIDGDYEDNRHPSNVRFTTDIKEDLARRDFTINAMAYNPNTGIVDSYGGMKDLSKGIIKCVGVASERFEEDALRIMRGLRFASTLGFDIEKETAMAMREKMALLDNIAVERINVELSKFIVGDGVKKLLMEYCDIFGQIIPEIKETFQFQQRNTHHIYDVWEHIARSVGAAPKDEIIRFAMLLHDIGKPKVFSIDDNGVGHFYGHGKVSEEIGRDVLNRLRFDNDRKKMILTLVKYHDLPLTGEKKQMKKLLNKIGQNGVEKLLLVKRADTLAQAPEFREKRLALIEKSFENLENIIEDMQCFSLKDLDIDGKELIRAGYERGPDVGIALDCALNAVIEEKIPNKKADILSFLEKSNKK